MNWKRLAEILIPALLTGMMAAYGGSEFGIEQGRERREAIRDQRAELVELVSIMSERCDMEIDRIREEGKLPKLSKGTYDRLPEAVQMAIPAP